MKNLAKKRRRKRNERKRNYFDGNVGSVTIETALIMPMILAVILMLVGFLLHSYNRNVMQVAACQGAMQAYYEQWDSNSIIQDKCLAKAEEVVAENMVGVRAPKVKAEVGRFKVRVNVQAESALAGISFFGLDSDELLPVTEAEWELDRFSQPELIRNIRRVKVIYEKGKGLINQGEGEKDDTGRIQTGAGSLLPDSQGRK